MRQRERLPKAMCIMDGTYFILRTQAHTLAHSLHILHLRMHEAHTYTFITQNTFVHANIAQVHFNQSIALTCMLYISAYT